MPARVFTTAEFDRFARKAKLADATLVETIERAKRGLVDADLGGGVVKMRVARPGQGRSGGFRTIIALVVGERAFFLLGYAKNEMENISDGALEALRVRASVFQKLSDAALEAIVEQGGIREIGR